MSQEIWEKLKRNKKEKMILINKTKYFKNFVNLKNI